MLDTTDSLGARIRGYREQAGLTQAELTRTASISKAYLSELENDVGRRPSADVLMRVADALGVTIAEILGRSVQPKGSVDVPKGLREFAEERKLPEEEIRMLAGLRLRGGTPRTKERWRSSTTPSAGAGTSTPRGREHDQR